MEVQEMKESINKLIDFIKDRLPNSNLE